MISFPEELIFEADLWKLVLKGIATWTELQTTWSFQDVQTAITFMELQSSIEDIMMPKIGDNE